MSLSRLMFLFVSSLASTLSTSSNNSSLSLLDQRWNADSLAGGLWSSVEAGMLVVAGVVVVAVVGSPPPSGKSYSMQWLPRGDCPQCEVYELHLTHYLSTNQKNIYTSCWSALSPTLPLPPNTSKEHTFYCLYLYGGPPSPPNISEERASCWCTLSGGPPSPHNTSDKRTSYWSALSLPLWRIPLPSQSIRKKKYILLLCTISRGPPFPPNIIRRTYILLVCTVRCLLEE